MSNLRVHRAIGLREDEDGGLHARAGVVGCGLGVYGKSQFAQATGDKELSIDSIMATFVIRRDSPKLPYYYHHKMYLEFHF